MALKSYRAQTEAFKGRGRAGNSHVNGSVKYVLDDFRARTYPRGYLQAGIAIADGLDEAGRDLVSRAGAVGHFNPAQLAATYPPSRFPDLLEGGEGGRPSLEYSVTRFSESDRAGASLKQLEPQLGLELSDLSAQSGLRNADALGGSSEIQLFSHGQEVAQEPHLWVHQRPLCTRVDRGGPAAAVSGRERPAVAVHAGTSRTRPRYLRAQLHRSIHSDERARWFKPVAQILRGVNEVASARLGSASVPGASRCSGANVLTDALNELFIQK